MMSTSTMRQSRAVWLTVLIFCLAVAGIVSAGFPAAQAEAAAQTGAQTCTWNGIRSSDWNDPDNWSCESPDGMASIALASVPAAGDGAIIPNVVLGRSYPVIVDGLNDLDAQVQSLMIREAGRVTLKSGAVLAVEDLVLSETASSPESFMVEPGAKVIVSGQLTMAGGVIGGGGALEVWDMSWSKGALSSVRVAVQNGLTVAGAAKTIRAEYADARLTVEPGATATWTGGEITVYGNRHLDPPTLATIDVQGVWDVQCDATMAGAYLLDYTVGQLRIGSTGVLRKTASAGESYFMVAPDNDGVVEVHTGTLKLGGNRAGETHGGDFKVKTGATLWLTEGPYGTGNFGGGAHAVDGSIVDFDNTQHGNVRFELGANVVDGLYDISGSTTALRDSNPEAVVNRLNNVRSLGLLTVDGASRLEINGSGKFLQAYDVWLKSTAWLIVNFDEFDVAANYTQEGAGFGTTFEGASVFRVSGVTRWTAGTINRRATDPPDSPGSLIAKGPLEIDGSATKKLVRRTLYANAGALWTGSGDFEVDLCVIENAYGQTFDIQGNAVLKEISTAGSSTFKNYGTLRKSVVAGRSEIQAILENSGAVEVQVGMLDFTTGSSNTGPFSVSAGATLGLRAVSGSGRSHLFEGEVRGAGTVEVHDDGTTTFRGPYRITGATTVTDCAGGATAIFDVNPDSLGVLTIKGEGRVVFEDHGRVTTAYPVLLVPRLAGSPPAGEGCPVPAVAPMLELEADLAVGDGAVADDYAQLAAEALRTGPGTLTIEGHARWQGGFLDGHGVTVLENDMTVDNDLYAVAVQYGHTLRNEVGSAVTWSGTKNLLLRSGANAVAKIDNRGVWDIRTDADMFAAGSGRSWIGNRGAFRKTAGSDTTVIFADFDNIVDDRSDPNGTFFDALFELSAGSIRLGLPGEGTTQLRNWGPANHNPPPYKPAYPDDPAANEPPPASSASAVVRIGKGSTLWVQGPVTNNGAIEQTLGAIGLSTGRWGFAREFANIKNDVGTDRYHGVAITSTASMGDTTVRVWGNQTCRTAVDAQDGPTSNAHAQRLEVDLTVLRCYELDPGTDQTAKAEFWYLASEANGNLDPYAWHYAPAPLDWELQYREEKDNAGATHRRTTGVWLDAYSPYALRDDLGPTAVDLLGFRAASLSGGMVLSWETASELNHLGFNLYRSPQGSTAWTRVNPVLIPSPELGGLLGWSYRWFDAGASSGESYRYRLEAVDAAGHAEVVATAAAGVYLPLLLH